jgi:hypothetical protein
MKLMTESLINWAPVVLVTFGVVVLCVMLLYFSCRLLESWINRFAKHFAPKIGISVPTIRINVLRSSIYVENLKIESDILLEKINAGLHDNCQFMELGVSDVKITLFPRIHVVLNGVVFLGFAKHPNNWSVENVIAALRDNRLDVVDALTTTIARRLRDFRRGAWLQYISLFPLHMVDTIIGTARLDIFDVRAGFCSRRMFQPDDVQMEVTIAHLRVRPSSTYNELLFTPMIKVCSRN